MDSEARLETLKEKKFSCPCRELNHVFLVPQLLA